MTSPSDGPPADPGAGLRFSVVVPTYDRPDRLARCLAALAALDYPRDRYEVVVVDDGSRQPLDDVVAGAIESEADLAVDLVRQANAGPAAARNRGAARARGRYLAFTDDDCTPTPGWLTGLDAALSDDPQALVGGRVDNALVGNPCSTASQILVTYLYERQAAVRAHGNGAGGNGAARPSAAEPEGFFASNNIAVPAEGFARLGGFDESFPLAAAEDRDLCARWVETGGTLRYQPDAVVDHHHALDLAGFCRQHANYGRGAWQYNQGRTARTGASLRVAPVSFYAGMLRRPFADMPARRALPVAGLLAVSQVATATGFGLERLRRRGAA